MRSYAAGSVERKGLEAALAQMQQELPLEVPCIVNGLPAIPSDHARYLCAYHEADESTVASAIDDTLSTKAEWEAMPWNGRAAELVSGKYRYKLVAATMLGQGKDAWQAGIDAAAELSDFFRFGVKYVEELYAQQPPKNSAGSWNRVRYRALEGFVLAVSSFDFTAIGGNLPLPRRLETFTGCHIFQLLGLPDPRGGRPPIQFVPGPPPEVVAPAISHPSFTALHFTGSTSVFTKLWKDIAVDKYRGYSRFVGLLLSEAAKIKVGPPSDFSNFMEPMIGRPAYDNIMGFIQKALGTGERFLPEASVRLMPTVILIKDPESITIKEEIFGPVTAVMVYTYDDADYEGTLFVADCKALLTATNKLRNAAGKAYYNEKCTGAAVDQQPFEGA
ncbi:Aldehyde/histidinol dehydrogenase [Suillus lakei]|nr:Aldehyde/histidinol dehydrogenase [Suillus lakei]